MPYPQSVSRPLARLLDWYRNAGTGVRATTDSTVLGVLPGSTTGAPAQPGQLKSRTVTVRPEHTGPNVRVFSQADLGVGGTTGPDVLALLIDEGRTPATPREIRYTFRALTGRHATDTEAAAAYAYVDSFGLLA